jgi:hypothetical protein
MPMDADRTGDSRVERRAVDSATAYAALYVGASAEDPMPRDSACVYREVSAAMIVWRRSWSSGHPRRGCRPPRLASAREVVGSARSAAAGGGHGPPSRSRTSWSSTWMFARGSRVAGRRVGGIELGERSSRLCPAHEGRAESVSASSDAMAPVGGAKCSKPLNPDLNQPKPETDRQDRRVSPC